MFNKLYLSTPKYALETIIASFIIIFIFKDQSNDIFFIFRKMSLQLSTKANQCEEWLPMLLFPVHSSQCLLSRKEEAQKHWHQENHWQNQSRGGQRLFFVLNFKVSKEADTKKDQESGSTKRILQFKKRESPAFPFWTKQSFDDSRQTNYTGTSGWSQFLDIESNPRYTALHCRILIRPRQSDLLKEAVKKMQL